MPETDTAIRVLRQLSDRIGRERVIWRYDPIIFSSETPPEYHVERFSGIAQKLAGATESATVSFCDEYVRTRRAFTRLSRDAGWEFREGNRGERLELLSRLAEVAAKSGMSLATCAERDLSVAGVHQGRCVDPDLLTRLRPGMDLRMRSAPTRPGCGCVESVDIGAYDTCISGCAYCYANRSEAASARYHASHDPSDAVLCRPACA